MGVGVRRGGVGERRGGVKKSVTDGRLKLDPVLGALHRSQDGQFAKGGDKQVIWGAFGAMGGHGWMSRGDSGRPP